MKLAVIAAVLLATLAGCGVKGDPVREDPDGAAPVSAPEAAPADTPPRGSGTTLF